MKRRTLKMMGEIVAVRDAQAEAAALASRRAADQVVEAEERRDAETGRQDARLDAWRAAASGPSLQLETAQAWAAALDAGEDALVRLGQAVEVAQNQADQHREAWRRADALAMAAQDTRKRAARRLRRREDEAAAAALEDLWPSLGGGHAR